MDTSKSRMKELVAYVIYGILTCMIILYAWSILEQIINETPWVEQTLQTASQLNLPPILTLALTLLAAVILLALVGVISKRLIWNRLAEIPMFASLTSSVDQVGQRLASGNPASQEKVVWVHWPNLELQTIGIVTGSTTSHNDNADWLTVIMFPTAGKVTGGMLRRVRPENVTPSTWTVNEALAFASSSGAVSASDADSSSENG